MNEAVVEKTLKLFEQAKQKRTPREARFDQAMRYTMPGRGAFFNQGDLDKEIDDIFDETAIVAVQEFASRFQAAMTPNHSRWADLTAGSDVPEEERADINQKLDLVSEVVFEAIHASNFAQESYEAYLDMSVSMGAMEVIDGDAVTNIVNNAIPLSHLWVLNGPYDFIDKFFRLRAMTSVDLQVRYPKNTLPPNKFKELQDSGKPATFLEATIRDWSEPATERHTRQVIWLSEQMLVHSETYEGIGSCPIIGFRWAKAAGEDWGRGPTLNALPAIKTCNLVVQMILENAQMAIAGVYNADDDVVNPDTIELLPGTIIPRSPGSRGLEAVQPAGNFNVAELVLNDMRANIKRALYNDMLGNPNKTPMSATEVAERMADLSRQIGSAFGRVWSEFCTPYLQRVIYILKQRGVIEKLPTVNGRAVKIVAKSPLAQAQSQIDIQNSDRLVELVSARFGPQLANVFIKGEKMSGYWAEKLQVPGALVRSEPEMKQIIEAISQQAQAAQAQQPAAEPGAPAIA